MSINYIYSGQNSFALLPVFCNLQSCKIVQSVTVSESPRLLQNQITLEGVPIFIERLPNNLFYRIIFNNYMLFYYMFVTTYLTLSSFLDIQATSGHSTLLTKN